MKRTWGRSRIGSRVDSRGGVVRALTRHKAIQRYDSIMQRSGQPVPYDPAQSVGIEFKNLSFLIFNVELTHPVSGLRTTSKHVYASRAEQIF